MNPAGPAAAGTMSEDERLDWLRLIRSENVGPMTFHHLLECYGEVATVLERLPELARSGGRIRRLRITSRRQAAEELRLARERGLEAVCMSEAAYPDSLRTLEDAPPVIYMVGDAALAARPCIAIVGARNASANSLKLAREFAQELSEHEFVIVSGMARGIDTNAHWGGLRGGSIAVLAGGADVIYPRANNELYEKLRAQGAVISEMPPGMQPLARHFPRRNRIIAGLSLGVVVMEATVRSGSLITAQRALEQGREVMVVPGSPADPRSHGGNALIKDGAKMVLSPQDIMETIAPMVGARLRERKPASPKRLRPRISQPPRISQSDREDFLSLIGAEPTSIEELTTYSRLPLAKVMFLLVELEIAGQIMREHGQKVSRIL